MCGPTDLINFTFQVNEVLMRLRIRSKGLERILESYLAIRPK